MATYLEAGVNLEAAKGWVEKLKNTLPQVGGFGGVFPLGSDDLVASTDGVGTKLLLAIEMERYDTVGIDLVAMNVNDILTSGARPLFFLDYIATAKLEPEVMGEVLSGIVRGCELAGCSLLGGETAQMNDLYRKGEFDLAGFAVGIVKREKRIDGKNIRAKDLLVGLPSSGIHSNGFSLVRSILKTDDSSFSLNRMRLNDFFETLAMFDEATKIRKKIADVLLTPTRIYVKDVLDLLEKIDVKGMAHITGGGFQKNIPRALPIGLTAKIREGSWPVPEVFSTLQHLGNISDLEMRRVFNRGIGFVLIMSPEEARKMEIEHYIIGEIIPGETMIWN